MKKILEKIGRRKIIQFIAALPITVLLINNFEYSAMIFIAAAAIGGAFYCGYLCPFGFLQELVSLLGKKLKIKKREVPEKLDRVLRWLRYVLLVLFAGFGLSFIYSLLAYDPRSNLYLLLTGKSFTITVFVSIIVFAGLSLFYNKIFCKYFCIQGARFGLASYFRIFSIKRNADTCVNCKLCDKACDMGIKVSTCDESVNSLNCINCFACVEKCPKKGTLSYGLVKGNKLKKKVAFAAVALIVIVAYNHFLSTDNVEADVDNTEVSVSTMYYEGTGTGFNGDVVVEVGVDGSEIVSINVLSNVDDAQFFNSAEAGVIEEILVAQSTEVDVVSGATYSSNGIINAVKDALDGVEISGVSEGTAASVETEAVVEETTAPVETEAVVEETAAPVETEAVVEETTAPVETEAVVETTAPVETEAVVEETTAPVETEAVVEETIVPVETEAVVEETTAPVETEAVVEETTAPVETEVVEETSGPVYYTGTGTGFRGDIDVEVAVENDEIISITVTDESEDYKFFSRAEAGVISDILSTQSTDVDVVSGATYSSKGIIEAVEDALGL